ncbi:non-ribosomal peptide synthetase [Streptomyces sp. N50]|uniref:non-ribosomal peptide synthetase n=1 Tax=Streptomyces sp. N50 TaxID=3081765 RepID=UPI0029620B20|nr:non-ribosomal peptide synthetase [Streptomyces sp. N50]WOX15494.1 amino acid adenylation domain-containing protein [Streptomyces sp. N50]
MNTPVSREDRIAALPAHLRERLARRLAVRAGTEAGSVIPRAPRDQAPPMSAGQQRLWFLADFEPDNADYNSALALRLTGALDPEQLRGALSDLTARHEALRTTFSTRDGQGVQAVHEEAAPEWRWADVSDTAAGRREERAHALVREEMSRPYDLRDGPLVRALLVRLAAEDHVLVLGMHHIVTDGWSLGIAARDLGELYAARVEGRDAQLPEVRVQYADYAAWQRGRLAPGGPLDEQVSWWKNQLKGLEPLELPTDRPRPAVRTSAGAVHTFELPEPTVDGLKSLARDRGATLFMALTATVKALLARYSGQEDIAVGTSSAGRGLPELDELVGFLVNTVVLRTRVERQATFDELLDQVKETVLEAFARQEAPFDRIVEAVQPERDTSRTPLVQASVVLQNTPVANLALPGVDTEPYPLQRDASLLDLTFDFEERDGRLYGLVEYSTDLFDAATIARMIRHLRVLADGAISDPRQTVATLPMLTDDEWTQAVHGWNATDSAHSSDTLVHERFAAQAARTPDAVAVISGDRTLTYRELDESANRLAQALRAQGAGADTRVGLCTGRGVDMAVGLLGILKAGAAYVSLDPAFPADRLAYMRQDAGVRLIVTHAPARDCLAATDADLVDLDTLAEWPSDAPDVTVAPDDLAYVIYTSGSTGNPKGVAIEHANVRHICEAWDERYGLRDLRLRFLSVSSLSVDLFFADLIRSILFGGVLVIAPKEVATEPSDLLDLIEETGATGIEIVPSLLNAVLQEVERRGDGFPGLRLISVGSEGWRVEDCRALLRQVREDAVVVNAYGGTEATVDSTVFTPTADTLRESVYVPIGRPLPNTRVYVLDAALQVVPMGVPGEIWIGGGGVGRGYHGRPDLTAERFVRSPFHDGERLYRTGDRARRLPGGDLEFLGRADDQVKIRGFRIELGEVESALLTHPDVEDAVVVAWQEDNGRRRLVAYVVTGADLPTSDLRGHLSGTLPEYMVPAVFVRLDRLPLTPGGKVDRRSLPEPEVDTSRLAGAYAAPRTEAEEMLARVWADVLGVDRVGIHDNFFELGGDSILSIQVVSRARDAGLRLTSKLLFLHQTVAALAEAAEIADTPLAVEEPVQGRAGLTPIQRWFFAEHTVSPDHYAMSVYVELAPGTQFGLLEQALAAVVEHHDALRMRYTPTSEGWVQEYGESPAEGLLVTAESADADTAALAAQESLDLAAGQLVRGVFFEEGAQLPPRLFLAVHHLVMDGVSWRIVLEDLAIAYGQLGAGRAVDLGQKTSSYQRWSDRLTEHVRSGALDDEIAYWQNVRPGQAPRLPQDNDGENLTAHEKTVEVRLDTEATEALLHRVPAVYRTRINDLLVTALVRVLADWTGQQRVVVGLEGHGREELFADTDLSRTIGWFTTHFPVALTLPADRRWDTLIKNVKEQLRAVPGNGLGYDALRFLSLPDAPGQALRTDGLPEISFNYLGQFDGTTHDDGLIRDRLPALGDDHAPDEERPYLLDVVGLVEDGRLGFTWIYADTVFEATTITRLAEGFVTALRGVVRHCLLGSSGGATPSDFPLARLDQAGVDRVVGDGRDVEDVYPLTPMQSGMLFHSLAEPDAGAYFEQMTFVLDGVTDPVLLEHAWQHVTDHLEILRGSLAWDGVERPLMVIHRHVDTPVTHLDWRGLPEPEQGAELDRYLAEDRDQGLDLSVAPLFRLALIRVSDTSVRVVRTSHHVLLDGWSTFQMLDELSSAYRALLAGGTPALPVRRPFRSYVEWLESQDLAQAETYWRDLLTGFVTPTALPYDHRPAASHRAQARSRLVNRLSPELSAEIYAFARRHRLTVNAVVQGAWALLLSRYTGDEDVVFGSTVAGRPADLPGADAIVGMLINTLPVRVGVDPDAPVAHWLTDVQRAQVEARQYEFVPLPRIHSWSDVERGVNLFDSLVVFENFPMDGRTAAEQGLRLHALEGADDTNYPLNLVAYAGDELAYALIYDTDFFEGGSVERIGRHLESLLAGMTADPQRPLAELSLVSDAEEAGRLVGEWSGSAGVEVPAGCVHEWVAGRAAESPDAVAVSCGDEVLSYGELEARANRLAQHLVSLGAGPGRLVALSVERGVQMVVGLLGILKSGAAYVPLDPAYPADRLVYMLQDSGAGLLVTHHGLQRQFAGAEVTVVDLDGDWPAIAELAATAPEVGVTADDVAYVIYTSGSTGRPKGVAVEHRSVLNLLANCQPLYGFGAEDVWTVFHSYAFDFSVWELWGCLMAGGHAVVVPQDVARSPEAMWHLLAEKRVTVFNQTPSMFRELIEHALASEAAPLEALRYVIFGGEALESKHVSGWFERFGGSGSARLVNMYGITETTVHVTYQEIRAEHLRGDGRIPAGRPLPSYRVFLLDGAGTPVPVGVPGEIHVAGPGLARGYLNRAGLTAERFPLNPFGAPGERMYRSGDVARWRADGTLEYLGRADDQVKIRGFRIELGEIESVLVGHPVLRDAVVVVHQGADGHRRLVAYAVTGDDLPTAELRAHLSSSLPDYMVPAVFVRLERLPLTPSGKVDRRSLPEPEVDTTQLAGTYTAPGTTTEETLARIWADVLGVEQVGIHDNFFELGGDSILSIQVVSRARQALGIHLSPRLLFDAPTVAGLADLAASESGETSAIPVVPRDGELQMSYGQQRLLFLEDFNQGSSEYHSAAGMRLTGALDVDALRAAVRDLVTRHEALRTTFDAIGDRGVQNVHAWLEPEWRTADLTSAPDPEKRLQSLVRDDLARPYDLRTGPLVRVLLAEVSENEHVCVLGMHHIVTDGWSMGIVARELGELYAFRVEGRPPKLPEVPLQYPDFAAWQRARLAEGGLLEEQLAWWKDRLDGIAPLELPTDRPRPAVRTSAGAVLDFEVPAEVVAALKELARERGATLFMALTAAVQAVFARYTGQEDIAVGTATSGRGQGAMEHLVGFLVNTLVLRSRIESRMTFDELLGQVRETVLEAFAHEDVPFERLVEAVQPERDTSRTPLVQAMVVLQNTPGAVPDLGGLHVDRYPLDRDTALSDLTLEFEEHDGGLRALAEYSTDLFDAPTIARFGEHLTELLTAAVTDPHQPLAALPLMSAEEAGRLVGEWSGSAGVEVPAGCVHEWVAGRAAESPDAVAVSCGDQSLTYGELEARANRLAQYLVSLGAGPGRLVALSVERGVQMVVGLLGILKSGAAYVPLDPAYPADRLVYMLQDSGAGLLVTHHGLQRQFAGAEVTVVDLDGDWPAIAELAATAPEVGVTADDVAYVIYTSGSTGRPKGVAVEHRSVLNLLANCQPLYGFGPEDVWTVFHSYAFDFSVWELWGCLMAGGRAVVVPQDVARSPEAMWQLLAEERVTVFNQTPSMFRELIEYAVTVDARVLPDLRYVIFGGEALESKHVSGWFERFGGSGSARLVNMYGITETTVHVTYQEIRAEHLRGDGRIPAGRPLPSYRVFLLDGAGTPVPVGVPGEIHVAGPGLARGYLNRAGLTAERFPLNPFGAPGERMYRSGDVARWRADGTLEYLGRADDQVKIRGFRIELGEIESVLVGHPVLRDAVVVVHQGADGHRRLVAYAVTGDDLPTAELREYLSGSLPDYMVPAVFVRLERLPLTPSGKVDRRSLPEPEVDTTQLGSTYTAPRMETEETLARVWSDVLGVEQVGIHDNFFELGGDSILSIQVVSRARDAGLRVTSKLMFVHQTVAALAEAAEVAEAPAPARESLCGRVELTPIQRWFFAEHTVDPDHYAMSVHVELAPGTEPAVLEQALTAVVDHHDALRMRYTRTAEGWVQEYGEPAAAGLLAIGDHANADAAALDAQESLELAAGRLVRGVFFDGGPRPRLFLAVHHLVMDGVSWRVVLEDLATAYEQLAVGRPVNLGPKTTSYQRWSDRLTDHVKSGALDDELPYWKNVGGLRQVPRDGDTEAPNIAGDLSTVSAHLNSADTDTLLQQVPAMYRTQINDVLLAALGRVLARWAGAPPAVNLEGHGREELFDDVELSRTVGWFTTIYPVPLDVPDGDWGTALKGMKRLLRKVPGRGLGYGALRHLSPVGAEALAGQAQPEVSFNYLGQWVGSARSDGLIRERLDGLGRDQAPGQRRSHLIDIVAAVSEGRLQVDWLHSTAHHSTDTIERLAREFVTALREIVEHARSGR